MCGEILKDILKQSPVKLPISICGPYKHELCLIAESPITSISFCP